jgi:transposase-like protein
VKIISGSSSGRRPRRRFTVGQIEDYLGALDRSGLSVAAFAREHDLVYSVLLRWVQRRAQLGKRRGRPPKLRELPLGALLGAGRWAAEIVRPDGLTVRVAHDVPAVWWRDLLKLGAC